MYSEPPFKFSYSAVMFNQPLLLRIKLGEIWSQLVEKGGVGVGGSNSLDGDFNSPECKITTVLPCPWGPF